MKTIEEQADDFLEALAGTAQTIPMTGKLITQLSAGMDLDAKDADGEPDSCCVAIASTLSKIGNRNRVVLVSRQVAQRLADIPAEKPGKEADEKPAVVNRPQVPRPENAKPQNVTKPDDSKK